MSNTKRTFAWIGFSIMLLSIFNFYIERGLNNIWESAKRTTLSYPICAGGNVEGTLIPMPTDGITRTVATMESLCEISNGEVILVHVGGTFDQSTLHITAWTSKWISRTDIRMSYSAEAITEVSVTDGAVKYVEQSGLTPFKTKGILAVTVIVLFFLWSFATS